MNDCRVQHSKILFFILFIQIFYFTRAYFDVKRNSFAEYCFPPSLASHTVRGLFFLMIEYIAAYADDFFSFFYSWIYINFRLNNWKFKYRKKITHQYFSPFNMLWSEISPRVMFNIWYIPKTATWKAKTIPLDPGQALILSTSWELT